MAFVWGGLGFVLGVAIVVIIVEPVVIGLRRQLSEAERECFDYFVEKTKLSEKAEKMADRIRKVHLENVRLRSEVEGRPVDGWVEVGCDD